MEGDWVHFSLFPLLQTWTLWTRDGGKFASHHDEEEQQREKKLGRFVKVMEDDY